MYSSAFGLFWFLPWAADLILLSSKGVLCRVRTNRTRGIYPGYYRTKNFCKVLSGIPVPGTSAYSARQLYIYPELLGIMYARGHNTRGTDWAACLCPLGTCVCSVRLWYNTSNFWKFCTTSAPEHKTSGSSVNPHTRTRKKCDFCKTVAKYPGYGNTFVAIPGELCIHSALIWKGYRAVVRMSSRFVCHINGTPNTSSSTYLAIKTPVVGCFFRSKGLVLMY